MGSTSDQVTCELMCSRLYDIKIWILNNINCAGLLVVWTLEIEIILVFWMEVYICSIPTSEGIFVFLKPVGLSLRLVQ